MDLAQRQNTVAIHKRSD